eukprot:534810_1
MDEIHKKTNCCRKYCGNVGENDVGNYDMAYRVIADHIRTLTFSLCDGGKPGSQNVDYVIRKICRRAIFYGTQILKFKGKKGFLKDLVDVVIDQMSLPYPEIKCNKKRICDLIKKEEDSFRKILDYGIKKIENLEKKGITNISGDFAFMLHNQYGFPIYVTELEGKQRGMTVDVKQYELKMKEQIQKSKN